MVSLPSFINLSLPLGLFSSPYIHRRLLSPCTCPPHTRRRTCSRPNPHLHILQYTARLQTECEQDCGEAEKEEKCEQDCGEAERRKLKESKNLAGV